MPEKCKGKNCHYFAGPSGYCKNHGGGPAKPAKPATRAPANPDHKRALAAAKRAATVRDKPKAAPKAAAKPFCQDCNVRVANLKTHYATSRHRANAQRSIGGQHPDIFAHGQAMQAQFGKPSAPMGQPKAPPPPKPKPKPKAQLNRLTVNQANKALFARYGNNGPYVEVCTRGGYAWRTKTLKSAQGIFPTPRDAFNDACARFG